MMAEIKHYVFDIGSVLIHYDPEIPFKAIIPDDKERKWFFENVCTSAWNIEQDRGRSWEQAEALLIADHPAYETQIKAFRANWYSMVPHHYPKSVAILETLIEQGEDVTLLTNFAADTFREAQEIFPFLKRSRGVTVSGEVQLIKPDPKIFEVHVESFGLEPTETFFIDDNKANVKAANEAGWNAMWFESPEQFETDFKKLRSGLVNLH
ncbi:MAG: HAD family phosphatase [Salaquimonas sp.]